MTTSARSVRASRLLSSLPPAAACALALGCAYANVDKNTGRNPDVLTGVAATVIMPGQTAPALPLPGSTGTVRSSGTPGSSSGSSGGTTMGTGPGGGAPPGRGAPYGGGQPPRQYGAPPTQPSSGQFVVIGGAETDEEKRKEIENRPLWLKPLLFPFAVVAYPFQKLADAVSGPEEPSGPRVPRENLPNPRPTTRAEMQAAQEKGILEQMERELAGRGGAPAPSAPAGDPAYPADPGVRATVSAPMAPGRPRSISEELEALRARRSGAAPAEPAPGPSSYAPQRSPAQSGGGVADQVEDRDRDGRPDHWVYRDGGRKTREVVDENGDGRPEGVTFFDAGGEAIARTEEDTNGDGQIDSWAQYEGGVIARRQSDTNGDGVADDWTVYRGGEPFRHEQDTKGQGFRDRVTIYDGGHLVREEEDRNGDGRSDVITTYDASGKVELREEDQDGDGTIDIRSRYRGGKLAQREVLNESALSSAGVPPARP